LLSALGECCVEQRQAERSAVELSEEVEEACGEADRLWSGRLEQLGCL
jgi:hypothetical protein